MTTLMLITNGEVKIIAFPFSGLYACSGAYGAYGNGVRSRKNQKTKQLKNSIKKRKIQLKNGKIKKFI
jgi:hypothetical protein